jgi:hypothetical protein
MGSNDSVRQLKSDNEQLRNQNAILTNRIVAFEVQFDAWRKMHLEYRYQIAQLVKIVGVAIQQRNAAIKGGRDGC